MNEKLKNVVEALKNNFNGKTKNLLFLFVGIAILVPLFLWLFNGEENVDLSQSFEKTQEKEQEEYIPPKLDNPFKEALNKESQPQAQEIKEPLEAHKQGSSLAQNNSKDSLASFSKDNQELEVESKLKELSNSNISQEEAIRQIAKSQKPKDMIAFLKEIQAGIELRTNSFKYELKTYKAGEKFLDFFLIESITNNFIRFQDTEYSYNLRFLGD
ncbi:hypothetical protein [Helicobacter ganmani]|uniref:hypothetical protein n=1 Tax=Helicobacter ganmani TaxID=60246 RepID=UPI003A84D3FB